MFNEPEDKAVNIDIDLAALGDWQNSLDDSIVSVIIAEQLLRATAATEAAVAIVTAQHTADTEALAAKITKVMDDIQDVYDDVLAMVTADSEPIIDSSYFVDGETGDRYTYSFGRRRDHPVLVLTKVEESR